MSLRHPAIAFDNQIAQTYRIAPKSKHISQTFQRPEFFLDNKAGEYFTKVERDIFDRLERIYESFSDVGEIRVYFASKILTPCRMH